MGINGILTFPLALQEEHQMHLEEALMAQALPTVNTLISMMGNLTETVASQRTLIQGVRFAHWSKKDLRECIQFAFLFCIV